MYLHLGQDVIVSETEVIGIFDLDNTTGSHLTRRFLAEAEKAGRVISVSDELPNSFVVCDEVTSTFEDQNIDESGIEVKIYLSQLSPQTLMKRSGTMRFE